MTPNRLWAQLRNKEIIRSRDSKPHSIASNVCATRWIRSPATARDASLGSNKAKVRDKDKDKAREANEADSMEAVPSAARAHALVMELTVGATATRMPAAETSGRSI